MKQQQLSIRNLCLFTGIGELFSMLTVTGVFYCLSHNIVMIWGGIVLTVCAFLWLVFLIVLFQKRLSVFTNDLCKILDHMIRGDAALQQEYNRELIFDRISHRLSKLYDVMQEAKRKVDEERQELQKLVSDISHQVKTPVSNLKMITETLLSKPVAETERREFLQGIQGQAQKLDFLVQTLVKTSRLETGVIKLKKKKSLIFDTLAQALSGIVFDAEKKKITVAVDCPQDLYLLHDSKWTAEVLSNLLDNAVKYTPTGGSVNVSVEQWEMYVKIDVADTGRGIAESSQAAVFGRFYREEEVHDEQGVGIGLYLAREIVTRQGGYIKVCSEVGKGATFSVFLPFG
ncbi:MAG: HAMP domain-containing histidine kinase [Lachnospiraceae bacterium]|nr:HAMP domain-containing histidine kinase [Lachnospiraceae bacterium]